MSNRTPLNRLAPGQISECLDNAGLSLWEFCGLFDLNYENAKRWMHPYDHSRAQMPPYWIGPVLAMLSCPHKGPVFLRTARAMRAVSGRPVDVPVG